MKAAKCLNTEMDIKIINKFLFSAGVIVLAAACLRSAILFQDTLASRMLLAAKDTFFGLQVRHELWALMLAELLVAGGLFFLGNTVTRLMLLAWAATNYLLFKFALASENIKLQTSFLGSLSDPFHLTHGITGQVLAIIPYYLLLGAYLSLGWLWLRQVKWERKPRVKVQTGRDGFWKMSCPGCGGHVKFALPNEGQKIPCPHCKKLLTLRREENLKMSCFFCQGHIAFPAYALGTKTHCPHCNKDITLKEP